MKNDNPPTQQHLCQRMQTETHQKMYILHHNKIQVKKLVNSPNLQCKTITSKYKKDI